MNAPPCNERVLRLYYVVLHQRTHRSLQLAAQGAAHGEHSTQTKAGGAGAAPQLSFLARSHSDEAHLEKERRK